jgi:hypothetical protein
MEALIQPCSTAPHFQVNRIIQYFAIFHFPLTFEEIYYFLPDYIDSVTLVNTLESMEHNGALIRTEDYYYAASCNSNCINNRKENAATAARQLPKAHKIGKLIAKFPFVKFVGISGSLSKGHANQQTDFDFFIITASNTLWICRTILHLFKKTTFLFRKQHWFCMNYFIDENHLTLEEKNMFTQVELSTLIPLNNYSLYTYLLLKNDLPNISKIESKISKEPFIKAYEKVNTSYLSKIWTPLNLLLMKLTDTKWRRKWRKRNFPENEYELCFKTTPYVSKNHPKNYQKRVLEIIDKN